MRNATVQEPRVQKDAKQVPLRELTMEELEQVGGGDGSPPPVVVDGRVIDPTFTAVQLRQQALAVRE